MLELPRLVAQAVAVLVEQIVLEQLMELQTLVQVVVVLVRRLILMVAMAVQV
jgi:hypothetical protein